MLGLDQVHFSYARREVLRGATLEARAGEVLALLGETGSGKSTVLRLLAGLETPARGRVLVGSGAVAGDGQVFVSAEGRRLGMVFQSLALWPHMTVEQSLRFVAEPRRGAAGAAELAGELLAGLGIAHLAARRPAGLSGGESALAAVARALAQEPLALLLDEPFAGLDPRRREEVRGRVFALARSRGLAVVYVTHLPEEALAGADRLAVLSGGRVAQCAAPAEVYLRPATAAVARLTGPAAFLPAEIAATAVVTPVGAFPRSAAARCQEFGTGWKGLAALRPEGLALAGDGPLAGRVLRSAFLGGRWRLTVRVPAAGGSELQVDSEKPIPEGSEVRLALRGDLPLVEDR